MNDAIKAKLMRRVVGPALILLLVWFALGFISIFATLGGYGFVPSTWWVATTSSFRISVGLVSGVLCLYAVAKGMGASDEGQLKKIGAILISPFMGYFLGSTPAVITGPMILAILAGHHVELPFKVAEANGNNHKNCRTPVELRDLPYLFDNLCSVPDYLRQTLKPGMRIIVEGRGTSLGLYASSFRIDQ
ncbi:hypothetical protein QD460_24385 [Rhizobium jaguaris]|uniref:hypothetical protein n=1 Tax=Rhizobium jaguaris TaxID=1312183 RepID=UPI0039BFE26B